MTNYGIGCCFFVDKEDELLGIMTDGDLRRLLISQRDISMININHINKEYYYENDDNKYLNESKKIGYIPILKNKIIIGIIKY